MASFPLCMYIYPTDLRNVLLIIHSAFVVVECWMKLGFKFQINFKRNIFVLPVRFHWTGNFFITNLLLHYMMYKLVAATNKNHRSSSTAFACGYNLSSSSVLFGSMAVKSLRGQLDIRINLFSSIR